MAGNYKIKIEPILDTAKLNQQLNQTKQLKLSGAGQTAGNSFMSGFGRAIKERAKYSIANFLIYGTQNAIKDMVANVRELDAAQTELRKVTDLSGRSLEKFTDQAYQVGSKVAKTGTEIVQASTEFAKMGKDTTTALQLSELASRFQNIADTEIDAATAAKFINSQLKAFGNTSTLQKFTTDFSKAERIIDVTNDTANKFAVGTNDLQNALTKTGSALSVAGNTFEQTIGLVTAGTEIMVGQPAKVGRGLRSIAINIANLARENEYFEAANGKVKIALQDSNGEMLSTYDIMAKLAEKWGTLNETEQTAIATSLAGKTQFEVFTNVMKNWATAAGVVDNAVKANGSSLRENEKYLDSIEGKLANFQSAWEQLSYHVVNSDFLKGVIDLGTQLVKILDNLVQEFGTLPTLIGLIGTAFGVLKLGKIAIGLTEVGSAIVGINKATVDLTGNKAFSYLSKELTTWINTGSILATNLPLIAGGIAALGVAIGAIAWDKYFSFDSSLKRLNDYQDKLEKVTGEIEALRQKRDSDDGLTNAEKTHLAVLEAEERSLERQIKLEQQRVQNAFKEDISTKQGKKYQERTGPTQLLDYQDSRKKELDLDSKILEKKEQIADAEEKAQYYRMRGDDQGVKTWEATADAYTKQLDKMYDKYVKLDAEAAEASANLGAYWEQVSSSVDYDALSDVEKEKFDEIHKAFIESQIDATNLKDSYTDVSNVINSAMDSLGHENLNLFDNIDMSSISTVEDAITQIYNQIQSLGEDAEISFQVKTDDGKIETFTKKVSELTDEDYQAIINFNSEGLDNIEQEKDNVESDGYSTIYYDDNGTLKAIEVSKISAADDEKGTITFDDNGTTKTINSDKIKAAQNVSGKITFTSNIGSILSNIRTAIAEKAKLARSASGKHRGEKGGLSWLGDEGSRNNPKPELVVSDDGAYLAGTEGWEIRELKSTDTVYSYAQTKKLLGGSQIFEGSAIELPRYKKGKKKKTTAATNANVKKASEKVKKAKSKAAKKKAKKNLQKLEKQRQKKRDAFDKEVEKLKHKAKVNHWTDAKYQSEYKKLYNKYQAYLSDDQSDDYTESREDYENERDTSAFKEQAENILNQQDLANFISAVNANDNLSDDEKKELVQDAGNKFYTSEFNRRIGTIGHGENVGNLVNSIQNNEYLNAKEKQDLIAETYKTSVEYNLKEYKNGKATREQILADIENYYKTRGQYDETYYKMLDELREADKEKELKRLEDLQKVQDNSLSLAQKYVRRELNLVQKQIDATKEEADQLERLTELEKELTNAKSKKIRVYREGVGFVYERDVEAIEKAEKALDDYKSSLNKTPLEERAEELQAILDLFDEIGDNSAIRDLEVLLGVGNLSELTGGIDTNSSLSSWATWISALFAKKSGLSDLISKLNDVSTSDLDAWLTASGGTQISDALLAQYIGNHSFASGTISAPGGLSRVAERLGGELVWLGKGDSVYSNAVSRNLMEWGRYNPAQVMNSNNSASTQVFNFDQIVLPNVYNANDFYRELQNLPNKALQQSARRA